MSDDARAIRVSRVIDAPAARIFAFLTCADNHPMLDTSGMVLGSADHATLDRVGTVFVMNMHNRIKGDHQVANHLEALAYLPVVDRDQLLASVDLLAQAVTAAGDER